MVAVGTRHLSERIADDQAWSDWLDNLSAKFAQRGKKDSFVVLSLDSNVHEVRGFPGRHAIRAYQWPFDLQSQSSLTRLLLLLTNRVGSILLQDDKPGHTGYADAHPKTASVHQPRQARRRERRRSHSSAP